MPKYLAQDFLAEALQHRRAQLERMLVAVPLHIEFVDSYVHRGDSDHMMGFAGQLAMLQANHPSSFNLLPFDDQLPSAFSYESIASDLNKLYSQESRSRTACCVGDENGSCLQVVDMLESFQAVYKSDSEDEEANTCSLSQDIERAIERYLPSTNSPSCTGNSDICNERFTAACLIYSHLQVDKGSGNYLFEEQESPLHLDSLLVMIPTSDDLSGRLKPKMIQDPLLDSKGQPYQYSTIFSSDFMFEESTSEVDDTGVYSQILYTIEVKDKFEEFELDGLTDFNISNDIDPLLELIIESSESDEEEPLILLPVDGSLLPKMESPDKSKDTPDDDETTSKARSMIELTRLLEQTDNNIGNDHSVEMAPDFSPQNNDVEEQPKILNMVELSNPDLSKDSNDSGIAHALLESPFLPPPFSPLTSTPLQEQLNTLDPIPMTPEKKLVLLSPISERKLTKKVWEREKILDVILARILPSPDIEESIENVLSERLIDQALAELKILPETTDGDAELDLPWDPLAESHKEISVASKFILSSKPLYENTDGDAPSNNEHESESKEVFNEDALVGNVNNSVAEQQLDLTDINLPESATSSSDGNKSDIPSLNLKSATPPGYNKPSINQHRSNQPTADEVCDNTQCVDSWSLIMKAGTHGGGKSGMANKYGSSKGMYKFSTNICQSPIASFKEQDPTSENDPVSHLDAFMLLRSNMDSEAGIDVCDDSSSLTSRKRSVTYDSSPESEIVGGRVPDSKKANLSGSIESGVSMEIIRSEKVTSPVFLDVYLSGDYQTSVLKIERFASLYCAELVKYGLHTRSSGVRGLSIDSLKFFLKQQQKALEDNQHSDEAELLLKSCQLAASLLLIVSVLDTLIHCSLETSIGKYSSLYDKYSQLIGDGVSPLKLELEELQSNSQLLPHPKLHELYRVVKSWKKMKRSRQGWREKVVVVIEREFPTLSGEILDFLQSLLGFEACVFSFASDDSSVSALYHKAVEERFLHYDCLVVPTTTLTNHENFPWEKVSLLIEYEQLKKPLFDFSALSSTDDKEDSTSGANDEHKITSASLCDRLKLREYYTLRTVQELASSGTTSLNEGSSLMQYTFIASENITNNTQLLQLLEMRFNMLVIQRDYYSLSRQEQSQDNGQSSLNKHAFNSFSHADLIIDQSTGVLLRPLSLLSTDAGLRSLINTTTALSFQFETCWVILYILDDKNYSFSGSVQTNISRFLASIAHYSAESDQFQVKVLNANSLVDVAQLMRRTAEETLNTSKIWSREDWVNRNWLSEEITKKEKVLLSFPCFNSFSAQLSLNQFTLGSLMAADLLQLKTSLPWLPDKVLKFFHQMCNSSSIADIGYGPPASLPTVPFAQASDESNNLEAAMQLSGSACQHMDLQSKNSPKNTMPQEYGLTSDSNTAALPQSDIVSAIRPDVIVLSSDDDEDTHGHLRVTTDNMNGNDRTFNMREQTGGNESIEEAALPFDDLTMESKTTDQSFHFLPPTSSNSSCIGDSFRMFDIDKDLDNISNYDDVVGGQQEVITHVPDRIATTSLGRLQQVERDTTLSIPHQHPQLRRCFSSSSWNDDVVYQSNHLVNQLQASDSFPTVNYSASRELASRKHSFQQSHSNDLSAHTPLSNTFDPPLSRQAMSYKTPARSTSVMNLISNTKRTGKTPTQRQIREAVIKKSQSNDYLNSHNQFPADYQGVVRSVPPTSNLQRAPLKSLDLGFDLKKDKLRLQSDDRTISGTSVNACVKESPLHTQQGTLSSNSRYFSSNRYHDESALSRNANGSAICRGVNVAHRMALEGTGSATLADQSVVKMKSNYERQNTQLPMQRARDMPRNNGSLLERVKNSVLDDPWLGCGIRSAVFKRPHSQIPSNCDVLVPNPSNGMSPPIGGVVPSLYGSPNTSFKLSPIRKKRLICNKDPMSSDGQTRLSFT